MTKIANYTTYNEAMQKTLLDKVWFLDKIDKSVDTIVDFGCADGAMFAFIEDMFPNRFKYIGIDMDIQMRSEAKIRLSFAKDRVKIIPSIDYLFCSPEIDYNKSVLVLSSVIHEIYSYCSYVERNILFNKFNSYGFRYIAIRDMHLIETEECINIDFCKYPAFLKSYTESIKCVPHTIRANAVFEFLLKYTYQENWEREKFERYLWEWGKEVYYSFDNYDILFEKNFSIPYLVKRWENDFMLNINVMSNIPTHKKVLLEFKKVKNFQKTP